MWGSESSSESTTVDTSYMNSQARIYEEKVYVRAVNPSSMLDNTFMIDYRDRDTALSYTEQLYTARGAQGMGAWKAVK